MNISKERLSIPIRIISCLFVGLFIFCTGTSVSYEPIGCAFLSDSRHYLLERYVTVTHEQPYPSPNTYDYTQELHYIDMVTGEDSIISSTKKSNFLLLQRANPSDSTFTMTGSDSIIVCLKDDLSKTIACPPNRYYLGNRTVALDCRYDRHFTATDLTTGSVIPHGDFQGLLAFHDCGILLLGRKNGPDSLIIQDLSGKVRAAVIANGYVMKGVYAGNNTFAYSTSDQFLHFIDAQDLHETGKKKLPDGMRMFSISPDGKKFMYIEGDGEMGLAIEDLTF